MSSTFVHLRLHSEYSISDGMVRVKPLIAAIVESQMPAVAVSDNNNMFALVKFYNAAHQGGVKPIIACDVWVASKENVESIEDASPLVLIARNEVGYRNLSELLSRAYLEGQSLGRVTMQRSWLAEQSDGLIALSAAQHGDVGRALLAGKLDEAATLARAWMDIFPDSYYLELHRTGRAREEEHIFQAVNLAIDLGLPVVATKKNLRPTRFASAYMTAEPLMTRAANIATAISSISNPVSRCVSCLRIFLRQSKIRLRLLGAVTSMLI
jgi:DNA polymerase-3 subunit alpha